MESASSERDHMDSVQTIDMKSLAAQTGLEWDGGTDDYRLFTDIMTACSLDMTREEYEEMEKDLKSWEIEGPGFTLCVWNDISGYEYWNLQQEEDNYMVIQVMIHHSNVDLLAMEKAIDKTRAQFAKYERY